MIEHEIYFKRLTMYLKTSIDLLSPSYPSALPNLSHTPWLPFFIFPLHGPEHYSFSMFFMYMGSYQRFSCLNVLHTSAPLLHGLRGFLALTIFLRYLVKSEPTGDVSEPLHFRCIFFSHYNSMTFCQNNTFVILLSLFHPSSLLNLFI